MKEIRFNFENQEDYDYFIKNVLVSFTKENGDVVEDENTINILIKNL